MPSLERPGAKKGGKSERLTAKEGKLEEKGKGEEKSWCEGYHHR